MNIKVDIELDQLIEAVKSLPEVQLQKIKSEIDKKTSKAKNDDLEILLLKGPTATKAQLQIIEANRKSINQWRIK